MRSLGPFRVHRVEPPDGSRGVLRDDPVLLLLSAPLDVDRLHEVRCEIGEGGGPVPARVDPLDGGRVLVVRPCRPLRPACEHRLHVEGLRDRLGREAPGVSSRFTTGPLSGVELQRRG